MRAAQPAGPRAGEHRRRDVRGRPARSRARSPPELDVGLEARSGGGAQLGERSGLQRERDLVTGRAAFLAVRRSTPSPRVLGTGTPGGRSPSAAAGGPGRTARTPPRRRSARRPRSCRRTRGGAPPCSGPDRAPIAPDSAAATSAPVEAITRAVNVEAFIPCSRRSPSRRPRPSRAAVPARRASDDDASARLRLVNEPLRDLRGVRAAR